MDTDEHRCRGPNSAAAGYGLGQIPRPVCGRGFYLHAELLEAAAAGRELICPAPGAASKNDPRFCTDHFNIRVEQRQAICPAGQQHSQCSRLEEQATGRVSYRFEWNRRRGHIWQRRRRACRGGKGRKVAGRIEGSNSVDVGRGCGKAGVGTGRDGRRCDLRAIAINPIARYAHVVRGSGPREVYWDVAEKLLNPQFSVLECG